MDADEFSPCLVPSTGKTYERLQLAETDEPDEPPRPATPLLLRLTVPLCCGAALVCAARTLVPRNLQDVGAAKTLRGNSSSSGKSVLLSLQQLQQTKDCTEYFSIGQDCSQKNLWECSNDDGSQAFDCCCKHGWGEFTMTDKRAPGTLNSAVDASKCVDLSMPYAGSGIPFKDGNLIISSCTWGNQNKMWNVQLTGDGHLRWASHPKFCIASKNGANVEGNNLGLERCQEADKQTWMKWTMDTPFINGKPEYTKPHLIKLSSSPSMCMSTGVVQDGTPIVLSKCNPGDQRQLFNLTVPPPPPPYADTPSLFCVALMIPEGYEKGLLEDQFAKKVGIFECNDYAVYSNKDIILQGDGQEIHTVVIEGSLKVEFGGEWHSALNTDVFIRFWGKVVQDARAWRNKWTAKLDPDAVFFPSRLREVLRSRWYAGDPQSAVYLNNCHRGMHGPIEVLSQQALGTYKNRWLECKNGEPYTHKQEDFYYRRCWAMLGIAEVDVYNLLFENFFACDERSSTRDGRHPCFSRQVSFHPFKDKQSWMACWTRGNSMHWSFPMTINDQEPSKENFHHA